MNSNIEDKFANKKKEKTDDLPYLPLTTENLTFLESKIDEQNIHVRPIFLIFIFESSKVSCSSMVKLN